MRTFYTTADLADEEIIESRYKDTCPFCKTFIPEQGESLEHNMLECTAWKVTRMQHLSLMIGHCKKLVTEMRAKQKDMENIFQDFSDGETSVTVALLLGGVVAGKQLDDWILTKGHIRKLVLTSIRKDELDDKSEPEEMEYSNKQSITYKEAVLNPNYKVIQHLTSVMRTCITHLQGIMRASWFISPYGVPRHTPGQHPRG